MKTLAVGTYFFKSLWATRRSKGSGPLLDTRGIICLATLLKLTHNPTTFGVI